MKNPFSCGLCELVETARAESLTQGPANINPLELHLDPSLEQVFSL